jgi:general secretion pathway protein F
MPRFAYSALSPGGDLVTGSAEGPDAAAVIARLHEQGLLPIDAVHQQVAVVSASRWRLGRNRALPRRDLAMFSQQLARLLKAHLPLDRALEILTKLAERRQVQRVLHDTLERVRDGSTLAGAMEAQGKAFPNVFVNMIRAGEAGGALEAVLSRAADFLTRAEEMRQKGVLGGTDRLRW